MKIRHNPLLIQCMAVCAGQPAEVTEHACRKMIRTFVPVRSPDVLRQPEHDASPDRCSVPVKPESHEVERLLVEPADLPVAFKTQADLADIRFDFLPHPVQLLFVRAEDHHIVHVSEIVFRPELLLDVEIRLCEKEVRVDLAEQHTDRQAVVHAENLFVQPQKPLILDDPAELDHEIVRLDAGIEFTNVHLQVILRVLPVIPHPLFNVPLSLVDAASRNAAHVQRVEPPEQPRLQYEIDTPVYHLIRVEPRLADLSLLFAGAFLDGGRNIGARLEALFLQHAQDLLRVLILLA